MSKYIINNTSKNNKNGQKIILNNQIINNSLNNKQKIYQQKKQTIITNQNSKVFNEVKFLPEIRESGYIEDITINTGRINITPVVGTDITNKNYVDTEITNSEYASVFDYDRQMSYLLTLYPTPVQAVWVPGDIHIFAQGAGASQLYLLVEVEFVCTANAPPFIATHANAGSGLAYPVDPVVYMRTRPGQVQRVMFGTPMENRTSAGSAFDAWTGTSAPAPGTARAVRVELYLVGAFGAPGNSTINVFNDNLGWFSEWRVRFYMP